MSPPQAELVTDAEGNNQLLYFTSTSLVSGGRGLVYISDRTGHPNLYYRDFSTGQICQLTRNTEGSLKSYVYFAGAPYRGFGKASVSLDPTRGIAYYIQGRQIRAVDLHGRERTLAELPHGQMTAFTHVSADGARLCVPTSDARALDDEAPLPPAKPEYDVDARVREEGLSSWLRIYDTATGKLLQLIEVPRAWVTHVQFSPRNADHILYNHEWPADCGVRRMWLWDGVGHRPLRTECAPSESSSGRARSRHDWTCHEMWERDGSAIIYHGAYHQGPAYLGRVDPATGALTEIALPEEWHQYGHFTVGQPGQLVSDGYYQTAQTAVESCGAWLSLLQVDWSAGEIAWRPLLRHGSSWSSQDAHPHPILDEACSTTYYTSDAEGKRAVYRVALVGVADR